ncbi:N-acetylmuramoyl-L-alanine amidase [Saccharomonospora xinjiangensis]|uniref:N-acetylmuramoyl-L-alanine amidase n=1 Tax=Saccharomonospora xinjiangensis XJ-54 TaxID=882086 RepID=I0V2H1_9PSEU|nr:N-acetylmuramoyl-L-alanine amidase [Saccharomonospora xinjiangensis]EID54324.1 N-acetylmuramoyl-L-alanine amidase [Saccharomonospora xinjiangensis XJ-54]QBQ62721.1 N-acetylmuramoyl-L-alanine amidase LytC precursor [Saccharomonospora xinjiangensis]
MRVLRRGDTGPEVAEIRSMLSTLELLPSSDEANGHGSFFDLAVEHAVRAFQQQRGLITDGVVGPATYRALRGSTYHLGSRPLAYLVSSPVHGDDVFALQERLTELGYDAGRPDGGFGPQTEKALKNFQRDYGLTTDGICGPATVRALRQLSPRARGGRPVFLREQEHLRRAGPRLRGKRIVIDPGHGGPDLGVSVGGVHESTIVWDLARRLEGRMKATGMEALISRGPDHSPSELQRAQFANEAGADLFLSLHCDGNRSPRAQGVASFHFGTGNGTTSTVGELLAGYIQREIAARTGMLDCRTHPKTWDIFTRTRCPAVRMEIGYLTNDQDRQRMSDPAFRDVVAEGILIAVKRLYLLGENDQPTGTFTFADVLAHELLKTE